LWTRIGRRPKKGAGVGESSVLEEGEKEEKEIHPGEGGHLAGQIRKRVKRTGIRKELIDRKGPCGAPPSDWRNGAVGKNKSNPVKGGSGWGRGGG